MASQSDIRNMDVEVASGDLKDRTLAGIPSNLGRLIYLASTRDYNTGKYHHDGLAYRFTEDIADRALASCHEQIFRHLVYSSLEDLVSQLELYFASTRSKQGEILAVWKNLEPYRVAIPLRSAPLFKEFFFSNIRIALAILETRLQGQPAG